MRALYFDLHSLHAQAGTLGHGAAIGHVSAKFAAEGNTWHAKRSHISTTEAAQNNTGSTDTEKKAIKRHCNLPRQPQRGKGRECSKRHARLQPHLTSQTSHQETFCRPSQRRGCPPCQGRSSSSRSRRALMQMWSCSNCVLHIGTGLHVLETQLPERPQL